MRERFVIAFADDTYSTDLEAIHDDAVDLPGTGERTGQWRLLDGELETRAIADDDWRDRYFDDYTTTPGAADQRLEGCWSGTTVPFGFAIVVGEFADDAGARERGAFAILAGPRDAPTSLMIIGRRLSEP